jgi:hypothetical protein
MSSFGLSNKVVLLAVIEGTYGTDATPTASANAMLVGSLDLTPLAGDVVQRNILRPYFGNMQSILVDSYATATFEIELAGSGTAGTAPAYDCLMKACGFSSTVVATTSVTYTPNTPSTLTDANSSATLYFNKGGTQHIMTGARGTFTLDLTVKKLPTLKFTFTGLLGTVNSGVTQQGVPTATFTQIAPVPVNTAYTTPSINLGSAWATPVIESLSLDLGADVKYRAMIGQQTVIMADRKSKGSVKIQVPTDVTSGTTLTYNWVDLIKKNTAGTLGIVHGTTAGNIITINSATGGWTPQAPKYSATDGVNMFDIPYSFNPVSGNDEFTIAFT